MDLAQPALIKWCLRLAGILRRPVAGWASIAGAQVVDPEFLAAYAGSAAAVPAQTQHPDPIQLTQPLPPSQRPHSQSPHATAAS
jgi:hypothetical protein